MSLIVLPQLDYSFFPLLLGAKAVLAEMRQSDPPVYYLVGTPKGRLTKLEQQLLSLPWQAVRPGVEVKVLAQEQELYVLAQSRGSTKNAPCAAANCAR